MIESTQGKTKNKPGPLAPPESMRPKRIITARSYSWTTYREKNNKSKLKKIKKNT